MSSELRTLKTQRTSLTNAVHSGVSSISVDGQTTTFASMRDMRSVLSDIEEQIRQLEGRESKRPRVSSINLSRGV